MKRGSRCAVLCCVVVDGVVVRYVLRAVDQSVAFLSLRTSLKFR